MHHGLGRNRIESAVAEVLDGAAGGGDSRGLIISENEQFVLDDRSACGRAELILLKWPSRAAGFVELPAIRIQLIVLKNLEQYAVHFVGAGLQIHVDDATRAASILRIVVAGDALHLTDCFHRWPDHEGRLI